MLISIMSVLSVVHRLLSTRATQRLVIHPTTMSGGWCAPARPLCQQKHHMRRQSHPKNREEERKPMSGRRDIPPSRQRQNDGWASDNRSAWYHEQPGALPPDQPTMPLASPHARPSFGSKLHDDQPDETGAAPPDELRYQRRSPARPAYRGRTSGDVQPPGTRDAWEEDP